MTLHSSSEPIIPKHEPVFFLPPVVIFFAAVCGGLYFLQTYVFDTQANYLTTLYGAFIPLRYHESGPAFDLSFFTTPVTYSLLHASFAHVAINMIWLAAFGAPLAQRIGSVRFVMFWIATSIGAAALHYVLYATSAVPLVGASGAISGMMGAAARFAFKTDGRAGPRAFLGRPLSFVQAMTNRTVVTFVAVWMVVNLISGLGFLIPTEGSSGIAWEAHMGGFLVGFFCLRFFDR